MYTLRMSRSFRLLAIGLTMLWDLVPQIACFMPDQMTETEQECCKQMAHDCSGSGMSHECCRTVVRTDAATLIAANRSIVPDFSLAECDWQTVAPSFFNAYAGEFLSSEQSPPIDSGPPPLILRI